MTPHHDDALHAFSARYSVPLAELRALVQQIHSAELVRLLDTCDALERERDDARGEVARLRAALLDIRACADAPGECIMASVDAALASVAQEGAERATEGV